jgi:hypothetical protein
MIQSTAKLNALSRYAKDDSNTLTSIRKATNLFLYMHTGIKKEDDVQLTTAFWY